MPKDKLKSKTPSNRPAQRRLRVQRRVSQRPKVFSGENGVRLWNAINSTNKPNNDVWSALYLLGCYCQELEHKLDNLANDD